MSFPDLIERDAVLRLMNKLRLTPCDSQAVYEAILAIPAATATGTQPSVNWDHLRPEIVALARDENGTGLGFSVVPTQAGDTWLSGCADLWEIEALASYTPGTCDWKDSLVMRPGYSAG